MDNTIYKTRNTLREVEPIATINRIIGSPLGVCLLGLLTFLSFAFSMEVVFYTFVVIYTIYVGVFAKDLKPLMPLFIFCYIAPSAINNPGKNANGIFFGSTGLYLGAILSVAVVVLFVRIVFDRQMGLRRLLGTKRTLLPGILALGASYFLSGILHPQYAEYAKNNLIFAAVQFASVFLLYYVFSATIDWDDFDWDYFATIGLVMGLVVTAELATIYWSNNIVVNGMLSHESLYSVYTGWGGKNNIAAIIGMSIPFAFYFACRKKHPTVFLMIACLLLVSVIFSGSRGSMIGAAIAFVLSFIYTFIKSENKVEFRLVSILLFGVAGVLLWSFRDQLPLIYKDFPTIIVFYEGSIIIHDANRLDYIVNGIKVFFRNPIFGQSFYPVEYELTTFIETPELLSFFPPRWHNTIVQMMASCGIVGIVAYLYHRVSTIKLYLRNRTRENTYLAFYIAAFVAMSLFDCHFFNVGPVLFYSMAFAVAEFGSDSSEYA